MRVHIWSQLETLKCWLIVAFNVLTLPYSHTTGHIPMADAAPDRCLLFTCVLRLAGLVPSFNVES